MSEGGGGNPWAGGIRGYIADLVESGATATAGLETFRSEYGGHVSTQAWYDLWGETAAAKAEAGRFFDVDYSQSLTADMYTDWAAGRPGQFAHQVGVVVRDLESGVEYVAQYTAVSDYQMSPQEAVDEALGVYTQGTQAEGGTFAERVRGGFLMGAYAMTGRKR